MQPVSATVSYKVLAFFSLRSIEFIHAQFECPFPLALAASLCLFANKRNVQRCSCFHTKNTIADLFFVVRAFFAFLSSAKKYIEPNKIDTTHARTQQKKRSSHSICADYASNRMRVRLVIRYVLLTRPFASARIFVYVWKEVARAGVQNLSSTL